MGLGACQQRRLWLRGLQAGQMEYLQCPRGVPAQPVPSTSSQTAGSKGGVRHKRRTLTERGTYYSGLKHLTRVEESIRAIREFHIPNHMDPHVTAESRDSVQLFVTLYLLACSFPYDTGIEQPKTHLKSTM